MGKFIFPLPGRKKQSTAAVDEQPQSKAQKFFGTTTPFNLDVQQGWAEDVASASGISVTVTDAPSPTYSPRSPQNYDYNQSPKGKGIPQGWDDESDILPRNFRAHDAYDGRSEAPTTLRQQPSSSTIRSWYDRSKQPLAVSQQTSSSAIARGLPSKAARMLDVENTMAPMDRKKKKPAMLNLTVNTKGSRQDQWDGMVLGPDMMTKSPSVLSSYSSSTPNSSRRLQKRPTKESLRSQVPTPITDPTRPSTSGSGRKYVNHPNGVPDLYGHYEQMSLRQLMDLETEELEAEAASPTYSQQNTSSHQQQNPQTSHQQRSQTYQESETYQQEEASPAIPTPSITRTSPTRAAPQVLYGHRHSSSQSTKSSKPSGRSQSPPASVSSRHTRTSKASKRTDYSFQDADIMGKSILSLSSDSEEDDGYDEPLSPTSPPIPNRTPSYYEGYAAHLNQWQPETPASTSSSRKGSRPRSEKRASFAPYHTYLPVPGSKASPSASSPSLLQAPSPARDSTFSESSDTSNQTWHTKSPAEVAEARAVTMLQAQGPGEHGSSEDNTPESEQASPPRQQSTHRTSVPGPTDQPTPPLSPSSVNFYIRSAHSSIDGSAGVSGDNRFIAVSRQEELLLAALRQRKKLMRQSFIAEEVSARLEGRPSRKSSTATHKSKSSTSTAGDSMFNFDFPAPPPPNRELPPLPTSANNKAAKSAPQLPPFSPLEPGMSLDTMLHSPPTKARSKKAKKGILKIHVEKPIQSARRGSTQSTQSEDWPISPSSETDTEELKLFLQDIDESDQRSVKSSHGEENIILRPRAFSGFKPAPRRKSSHATPTGHRSRPSVVPEAEEEPQSPTLGFEMGFQTLRPVASITADDFPSVPSNHNKTTARLSAVGNPGWEESAQ